MSEEQTKEFLPLWNMYRNFAFKACLNITRCKTTSEDLTQEVFIKLFEKDKLSFSNKSKFSTWIYQVAKNHALKFIRKKRIEIFLYEPKELERKFEENFHENLELIESENLINIEMALERINQTYAESIKLKYFENHEVQEIAKKLKLGKSAVKMRLLRGRKELKNILKSNAI